MTVDIADALANAYFVATFAFAAYMVKVTADLKTALQRLQANVEILMKEQNA